MKINEKHCMTFIAGWIRPLAVVTVIFLFVAKTIAQQKGLVYTPTTRGEFLDDQRIGVWEFRDTPSTIGLKIDYTAGELTYIKPDTSYFYIADGNRWKASKLKIPCRPHGSKADLQAYYFEVLASYASSELKHKDTTTINAQLIFVVDESGLATNPQLFGRFPDSFHLKIMNAFKSAPQFWIVGIDHNDNTVKARLAINFRYCLNECASNSSNRNTNSKTVLDINLSRITDPKIRFNATRNPNQLPFSTEGFTQAFSPDDEHILVELMETVNNVKDRVAAIYNISKGTRIPIPFMGVTASSWLDTQRILFKYNFANQNRFDGIYNLKKSEVTHYSDSATFFAVCSPTNQNVAFVLRKDDGNEIWRGPISSLTKELILKSERSLIAPLEWSPNGNYLVLQELKDSYLKLSFWNPVNGTRTTMPLFGAAVAGWSEDNDSVYLFHKRLGAYDIVGEIFRYSMKEDKIKVILPKTNGLFAAAYSSAARKFALIIREDLYIWDPTKPDKPQIVRKKAGGRLTWSNNGKMIAFYALKDGELYILDLEKSKERKITQINNK